MANADKELEKYTRNMEALLTHEKDNSAVFKEHQRLAGVVMDAHSDLEDAVAEEKRSVSNGDYKATYLAQTQTFADIEAIDQLIAAGKIDKDLRAIIVKTIDRPPRILIGPERVG